MLNLIRELRDRTERLMWYGIPPFFGVVFIITAISALLSGYLITCRILELWVRAILYLWR